MAYDPKTLQHCTIYTAIVLLNARHAKQQLSVANKEGFRPAAFRDWNRCCRRRRELRDRLEAQLGIVR